MTKALSMTQMLLIAVPAAIFALVALAAMWRGERVMQEEMSVTQMLTIVVLSAMFGIGALALALWLV
jgi:heme/copper-type cytochrome/quinol oxidase subunit 1